MTKAKKNLILRYAVRAEELFHEHSETCEKIEAIIGEASKVEILDVLYQPGDGIVIAVDFPSQEPGSAPENLPIEDFLERYVK